MTTKIASLTAAAMIAAAALIGPLAYAQTAATMPALYNSSGTQVNAVNSAAVPAGTYYLAPGAQSGTQVYYYGNGTYYDPSTGLYGGSSVFDPNGTAGVSLGYNSSVGTPSATPGLPDTGAGGNAPVMWTILAVSGLVALGGAAYLATASRRPAFN